MAMSCCIRYWANKRCLIDWLIALPTTHDRARPHANDRTRTTARERPRLTTHDRPRTNDRKWPRTNDRPRPRKNDHARPTTQVSIRRLPYLFGEAVHVVPPCERLNTNVHIIIRLANWGDLGSFCLLIHGASYRWAIICCTMLRILCCFHYCILQWRMIIFKPFIIVCSIYSSENNIRNILQYIIAQR